MKKFYVSLAGLAVAAGSLLLLNVLGGVSNAASDCDNNAIISCGVSGASALASTYKTNKTHDLDNIYHAYGLSDYDVMHAGSRAKMGAVHKDGRVTVGGETVATGAESLGRQNMAGSHKKSIGGRTYYERTPSVSFASESISAFVFFDANGEFKAAIITSCGNPVTATPKPKPKPKPQPVYACEGLGYVDISRTEYRFTADASAKNGATISGYTFDFGDGKKTTTSSASATHDFGKEGTYTTKVAVNVKVNGDTKTVASAKCQVRVTVQPKPETPRYSCDSLEQTKISRTEYSFDGKATATGGATVVGYTFDFGDGKQQAVTNPTGVKHTYEKDGTFETKMSVTVKVGGETKTVSSPACEAEVTITPPNKVQVCNPETGKIITVDEKDQGNYKPIGDKACQPPEECKPGVSMGSKQCNPCQIPGKEQYAETDTECVETPATELPHTGPMDFIGGSLGLGSLVTAAGYYAASRRGLLAELLKR